MPEQINSSAGSLRWAALMSQGAGGSADEALVAAARAGDRGAFGELYTRYCRMVHGVLLSNVPRHAVDDLVQDVFVRALRRLETLREPSCFGGWLASIARNCAVDFYRRAPGSEVLHEEQLEESAVHSMKQDSPEIEAGVILAHIQALPAAYRETLVLRLVEGMTGPEIAARTGLSHGSVRVNLHRGMEQLRQRLAGRKREMETDHE